MSDTKASSIEEPEQSAELDEQTKLDELSEIVVEKPSKQSKSRKTRTHIVARGENLGSIAAQYDTTWRQIHADNRRVIGSNPNVIYAGQRLVIN